MNNGPINLIKEMNPWWKNDKWYVNDHDYYERVMKSPFMHRWFPILDKAMKDLVTGKGSYDVLILTGPRRTGKTSLIKRLIEKYHSSRAKFIYIVLDDYSLRRIVKNRGLKDIILKVKEELKIQEPLIIVIDEASALDDWDVHVKNIIDSFASKGIKFLLIVTGSLGLRLIRGSTNILGRRGDIPAFNNITNPGVILPYKFSEYAESLRTIRTFVRGLDLLRREEREKTLLSLVKPGTTNRQLRKLLIMHNRLKEQLEHLFNAYLITGGYPLIVYETIIKNNFERLDAKWYEEFAGIILEDIKYTQLRINIARYVLEYFREVNNMSPIFNLNKLEKYVRSKANLSKRDLRIFRIEDYIEYFTETFIMVKATEFVHLIKNTDITREVKLFITDPFIFHAIMYKDYTNPFEEARKSLRSPSQAGILVEHVVSAHFLRLKTKPVLYYHLRKENDKTTGEIDCICYFKRTYIPVEVKYIENEVKLRKGAEKVKEILQDLNIKSRPVIVNKDIFEIAPDYVIIPAYIYLLLF
ncbi:MAG: ATP-binding protein [Candidatus Baldrarchaeia archaeon]